MANAPTLLLQIVDSKVCRCKQTVPQSIENDYKVLETANLGDADRQFQPVQSSCAYPASRRVHVWWVVEEVWYFSTVRPINAQAIPGLGTIAEVFLHTTFAPSSLVTSGGRHSDLCSLIEGYMW